MPIHDASYKHWDGVHLSLWGRRWAIARNSMVSCLQNKWLRYVAVASWMTALLMGALLFMVGQLLVADSIVVKWVANFNPDLQSFARMLTTWLEQHPEISVRTTQNVLFYFYCSNLMRIGIFVLGMGIPWLISRDLASNAIIIYSSKAVSRGDYVLGKFSAAAGLLLLTWIGPVLAAWLMGNLLAPDWRFFWHSRAALFDSLAFGIVGGGVLSLLALGVSAISQKEISTTAFWYVWWIVGGVMAPIATHTLPWLRHISFHYNLGQLALWIFRPAHDLQIARDNIPIFGQMLQNVRPETMTALNSPAIGGALFTLFLMALGAGLIIKGKVRPE